MTKAAKSPWGQDSLYSSKDQTWRTPQWLFDLLNERYSFELDAAACADSTLCKEYFDRDALEYVTWPRHRIWLNPPYGRNVGKWVAKAREEAERGKIVVVLIFARTDTAWWHDHAMKATDIYFIRGRVKFKKGQEEVGPAPAPSAVLVFNGKHIEGSSPRVHAIVQP
jgi:site-specific DNA-methyltransferase (adenine-specific)|tara:strand:+ start:1126 stop:1626 length:501 start_codon:yes stop_codon:yes gene_type:complete